MTTDQINRIDRVARVRPAAGRRAATYAYVASVWSLLYAGLALGWAAGVPGWPAYPFDRIAGAAPPLASALHPYLLAALAMAGSGAAIAMANGWGRSLVRSALLATGRALAIALALAFTTERLLILLAYTPVFLVGAPFGWPPVSYADQITWPVVHEAICLAGAGLWAMASLWYRRTTAGAHAPAADHAAHARALRRDRAAVAVAVAVPVLYALTRYAWLLDIPLGISGEFLREGRESGLWVAGAGLATFAVVGAVLTLGLVQRWGEVFPRWMPLVGGRRVPPALATVPATAVAWLIISSGLAMWRQALAGALTLDAVTLVGVAPGLLFPLWGVALGLATLGYRRRRVGPCPQCGS